MAYTPSQGDFGTVEHGLARMELYRYYKNLIHWQTQKKKVTTIWYISKLFNLSFSLIKLFKEILLKLVFNNLNFISSV